MGAPHHRTPKPPSTSSRARPREGAPTPAAGTRVLLVSTDPAHSLRDALGLPPSKRTSPQRVSARLHAVELDADAALTRWIGERRSALRRIVGRGTYLDDDDIDALL